MISQYSHILENDIDFIKKSSHILFNPNNILFEDLSNKIDYILSENPSSAILLVSPDEVLITDDSYNSLIHLILYYVDRNVDIRASVPTTTKIKYFLNPILSVYFWKYINYVDFDEETNKIVKVTNDFTFNANDY